MAVDYNYKAKLLNVGNQGIEVKFDTGFYSFTRHEVALLEDTVPKRMAGFAPQPISLVQNQDYIWKTYKPGAQILLPSGNIFQCDPNCYTVDKVPTGRRYTYKALVISCHDGDTFKAVIDLGFKNEVVMDVRMQGINAPEITGGTAATKAAAQASKSWLESKILNKQVILETWKMGDGQFEKYGRYLAHVYEPQDFASQETVKSLNAKMLQLGLATYLSY
jgi:endonuclease YncB( thermonuclease family)